MSALCAIKETASVILNDAALSEVIKQFSYTSSLGEQEASENQSELGWGPSEGSGLMAHRQMSFVLGSTAGRQAVLSLEGWWE